MASTNNRDEIWNHDGEILGNAPRWATYRKQLNSEFPAPYRGGVDRLAQEMKKAVEMIDELRPTADGKAFLGSSSKLDYTYPEVKNHSIPQKAEGLDKVIADCVKLFNGMPDVSSPLTMSFESADNVKCMAAAQQCEHHRIYAASDFRPQYYRRRICVECP